MGRVTDYLYIPILSFTCRKHKPHKGSSRFFFSALSVSQSFPRFSLALELPCLRALWWRTSRRSMWRDVAGRRGVSTLRLCFWQRTVSAAYLSLHRSQNEAEMDCVQCIFNQ